MNISKLPAVEFAAPLKMLLLALGRQGNEHLTEVDADLQQTNYLLVEAIAKLSTSFIGLHDAMKAQQVFINKLQENAVIPEPMRSALERLQKEADSYVSSAVTALQFQDMTNQLIGRIVGHVASLQQVLKAAGTAGASLEEAASNEQALLVLFSIGKMLDEKTNILDHVSRKPVAQTHMESGDIELF